MPDETKSPLDQALDLLLFAPAGLVLTARETLPDLAVKGRQRITTQVAMARMIGKFAVDEGEKLARRRIDGLSQALAGVVLPDAAKPAQAERTEAPPVPAGPGHVAPARAPSAAAPPTAPAPAAGAGRDQPTGNGRAQSQGVPGPSGPGSGVPGPSGPGSGVPGPARSRAALAIPGYDTLSASQVVQRLAGLAPDELEAVRQYEGQTRGRRTILSKIAQLQTGPAA